MLNRRHRDTAVVFAVDDVVDFPDIYSIVCATGIVAIIDILGIVARLASGL
ncbi:hypothetical protein [Bifidobacterium sp. ESL0745]|uniref:hypothetical protein n=1 Tax=Bifidobacterium sp. ESL0745 TaxID=2983226 RepID=UPI0023F90DDF|nr:hypothetical protein [Bifidobacterium sp. ESL0745]MDF7665648.1 hypothetical protein [Bifidobacterium sp. ESL0745]